MSTFLDRHLNTPVRVRNRVASPEPDRHGNTIYVLSPPIDTNGRLVERASGPESMDGRSAEQGFTLFLPGDMAGRIDSFAQVEAEGFPAMEVVGTPVVHESLTATGPHHLQVTLRRGTA